MKTQHKRAEYSLSTSEVQQIINNAKSFRDRCIIKCLYYCGMRVSEVSNLEIQHIDFYRKIINIFNSKNNKTRTIPFFNSQLISDLKHYINNRTKGYVFLSNLNRQISIRMIQYIIQNTAKSININNPNPLMKNINPHIFRHSIARHLKDYGYRLEFIQKFLGHNSMKTTADMYGTLSLIDMQKIIARNTRDVTILPNYVLERGEPNPQLKNNTLN